MAKIKTSFSGHDKFECKVDWISKGLKAYKEDNKIFLQSNIEQSVSCLGLGINMIKSLHYWMKALGLIDKEKLTLLGELILENDLYLENNDTLWILHWNLVKDRETATLYYLFFNQLYLHKFSKKDLFEEILNWLEKNDIALSPITLSADVDVLLKMYRNNKHDDINMSLLSDLNILMQHNNENYSLNINSTSKISDKVFLYILSDYIDSKYSADIDSISIDDIQRGKLSIQKSLCMSENSLFSKVHNLSNLTNNKLLFSEAAGLRQIYISEKLNKLDLLKKIYE
nr:DUF4007 family protein [Candidatus Gracilibacteria bacterium]